MSIISQAPPKPTSNAQSTSYPSNPPQLTDQRSILVFYKPNSDSLTLPTESTAESSNSQRSNDSDPSLPLEPKTPVPTGKINF